MSRSLTVRAILGVAILGLVLLASALVAPGATLERLETVAGDPTLFAAVVVGLYAIRPLFAWPTTPLAVVVGYGYGLTLGIPVALMGVALTVIPSYLVTLWLVGDTDTASRTVEEASGVETPVESPTQQVLPGGGVLRRSRRAVSKYYETTGPMRGVIASRLAPVPSDVATCAAAVSGVRLRHLVGGTVVGELPWTVVGVALGASAAALTADTIAADGLGQYGLLLAVLGTAGAIALITPRIYHRIRTDGAPAN